MKICDGIGVEVNRAVSFDGALGCKLETYTLEALAFHQASEGILSNFYGPYHQEGRQKIGYMTKAVFDESLSLFLGHVLHQCGRN